MIKLNGGNGILTCVTDNPGIVTLTASDPACVLTPSSFVVGGGLDSYLLPAVHRSARYLAANDYTDSTFRTLRINAAFAFQMFLERGAVINSVQSFLSCHGITANGWAWAISLNTYTRKMAFYNDWLANQIYFTKVFAQDEWLNVVVQLTPTQVILHYAGGSEAINRVATITADPLSYNGSVCRIGGGNYQPRLRKIQMISNPTSEGIAAYIAGGNLAESGLITSLPCAEESGSTCYDISGNNKDFGIEIYDPAYPGYSTPQSIYDSRVVNITGLTGNEQSITYDITTIAPGTAITITASRVKYGFPTAIATETDTCVVSVPLAEPSDTTYVWASDDPSVATVVGGVVTGVANGTCHATATTTDGSFVATCEITVPSVRVSGVTLSRVDTSLDIGDTRNLVVTVWPLNASDRTYTLATSDPTVATIPAGDIVGVGNGSCNIVATTTDGGFTATCVVHVPEAHVEGVTLDDTDRTMIPGSTFILTPTIWPANAADDGVTWSTTDASVATVSPAGHVTAVTYGTCDIGVTTDDGGFTAVCHITVPTIDVIGVSLDDCSITMTVGESETLTPTVWPVNATNPAITWTSSNPSAVSVVGGVLTAHTTGATAAITVRTVDGGFTAVCNVTEIYSANAPLVPFKAGDKAIDLSVNIISSGNATTKPRMRVQWRVTEHISIVSYRIYRSLKQSELGTLIATIPATIAKGYTYIDTDIELGNRYKEYFYTVHSILKNGNIRAESSPESCFATYRKFELEALRGQEIYFRTQAGYPLYLYSKLWTTVEHCPVCWDRATGRANPPRNGCELCYGTGILNPLMDPELIWVSNTQDAKQQQAGEMGRVTAIQDTVTANGIPHIFPGDYLYDPLSHTYLAVQDVVPTGSHGRPITQQIQLLKIDELDSVYKFLSLQTATVEALNAQVQEIQKQRRF